MHLFLKRAHSGAPCWSLNTAQVRLLPAATLRSSSDVSASARVTWCRRRAALIIPGMRDKLAQRSRLCNRCYSWRPKVRSPAEMNIFSCFFFFPGTCWGCPRDRDSLSPSSYHVLNVGRFMGRQSMIQVSSGVGGVQCKRIRSWIFKKQIQIVK